MHDFRTFFIIILSSGGASLQINKFEVMSQSNQGANTDKTQFSKNQDGFFPFAENTSSEIIEDDSVVIDQRRSLQPLGPSYESIAERNAALIKSSARNSENDDENGSEGDRRKRLWKIRKRKSDLTEENPEQEKAGDGAEDYKQAQSVSAIFIGSVCAGVVAFPCLITILVCLWYV